MRRVFSTAGNPIFLTAASTSPAPFTSANEVVAIPNFLKRLFRHRPARFQRSGGGYTGTCFAKNRAARLAHLKLVRYEVPTRARISQAHRDPNIPPSLGARFFPPALAARIATTSFAEVNGAGDVDAAVKKIGLPAVLKTRRMGYDGKGQWVLRTREDVEFVEREFPTTPLLLESFVVFQRSYRFWRRGAGRAKPRSIRWWRIIIAEEFCG